MPSRQSTTTVACGLDSGLGISGLSATGRRASRASRSLKALARTRWYATADVAIGDGRNLPLLPRDCDVFGVDISSVLLEKCRHDYPDRHLHLIVGQAEALPFPDATFDNLFSLGAINHVNDPGTALREMARVVKPGGTIVCCR